MAAKKFDLSIILKLIDKATKPMKDFQSKVGAFGAKTKAVGQKMTLGLTVPLAAFGALSIKTAAEFQSAMNFVGAVTKSTGTKAFGELNKVAKELGATTQFSARQAAEAMKFMGQAGLTTNEIIGASPKVLQLAAAAQLDMGSAANIVTNIMKGFSFQTSDLSRVNDVLVNAFTSTNVDLSQLGEAFKKAGPITKNAGLEFEEVAAALGAIGNAGIQGSEAGTALRRMMINLTSPTKKAKEAMGFLELNLRNTDGSVKSLISITKEFENAMAKGATQTQINDGIFRIFGARALVPFQILLKQGSVALTENTRKFKEQGAAARVAESQMVGLPGALKLVASSFEAVRLAIVESGFGNAIEFIMRKFSGLLRSIADIDPKILNFSVVIATVVAAAGPLLLIISGLALAFSALSVPFLAGLALAFAAISAPVLLVVGGVALLIAGFAALLIWSDDIVESLNSSAESFSEWSVESSAAVIDFVNDAKQAAKDVIAFFVDPIVDAFASIKETLAIALNNAISAAIEIIPAPVKKFLGLDAIGSSSVTDVNINVKSESGSQSRITGINSKGTSNVNVTNDTSLGSTTDDFGLGFVL